MPDEALAEMVINLDRIVTKLELMVAELEDKLRSANE